MNSSTNISMTSNRPYLIRALYDWILDNQLTPYIVVHCEQGGVDVPMELVKQGHIVFNLSPQSCRGLNLGNEVIVFTARFGQHARQVMVSPHAVTAIYAMENGDGMEFPRADGPIELPVVSDPSTKKRPHLSIVKKEESNK
jgi:stringent starvation protein B